MGLFVVDAALDHNIFVVRFSTLFGLFGGPMDFLALSCMISPSLWSVGPLLLALQFEMASCGSAQCPATMLFAIVLFSQVELGMLLSR